MISFKGVSEVKTIEFSDAKKAQEFVDVLYRNKLLNSYKFESETHKLENGIIRAKSNKRVNKKAAEQGEDK